MSNEKETLEGARRKKNIEKGRGTNRRNTIKNREDQEGEVGKNNSRNNKQKQIIYVLK